MVIILNKVFMNLHYYIYDLGKAHNYVHKLKKIIPMEAITFPS